MIEQLDKTTKEIVEITIEKYLEDYGGGTKGQLNSMIGLAKGSIFQSATHCWRLKGLAKYEWEWKK